MASTRRLSGESREHAPGRLGTPVTEPLGVTSLALPPSGVVAVTGPGTAAPTAAPAVAAAATDGVSGIAPGTEGTEVEEAGGLTLCFVVFCSCCIRDRTLSMCISASESSHARPSSGPPPRVTLQLEVGVSSAAASGKLELAVNTGQDRWAGRYLCFVCG